MNIVSFRLIIYLFICCSVKFMKPFFHSNSFCFYLIFFLFKRDFNFNFIFIEKKYFIWVISYYIYELKKRKDIYNAKFIY